MCTPLREIVPQAGSFTFHLFYALFARSVTETTGALGMCPDAGGELPGSGDGDGGLDARATGSEDKVNA